MMPLIPNQGECVLFKFPATGSSAMHLATAILPNMSATYDAFNCIVNLVWLWSAARCMQPFTVLTPTSVRVSTPMNHLLFLRQLVCAFPPRWKPENQQLTALLSHCSSAQHLLYTDLTSSIWRIPPRIWRWCSWQWLRVKKQCVFYPVERPCTSGQKRNGGSK